MDLSHVATMFSIVPASAYMKEPVDQNLKTFRFRPCYVMGRYVVGGDISTYLKAAEEFAKTLPKETQEAIFGKSSNINLFNRIGDITDNILNRHSE